MSEEVEDDKPGWPILTLWAKYEDIAMHFNDLILKLRTAALGGVAVLATLVSIFGKSDPGHFGITWEIAFLVFIALILFWLAIWVLDFAYYNKLLLGAIDALTELEKVSATEKRISQIKLSILVENSVLRGANFELTRREKFNVLIGRWSFYILVLAALVGGAYFSHQEYATDKGDHIVVTH